MEVFNTTPISAKDLWTSIVDLAILVNALTKEYKIPAEAPNEITRAFEASNALLNCCNPPRIEPKGPVNLLSSNLKTRGLICPDKVLAFCITLLKSASTPIIAAISGIYLI